MIYASLPPSFSAWTFFLRFSSSSFSFLIPAFALTARQKPTSPIPYTKLRTVRTWSEEIQVIYFEREDRRILNLSQRTTYGYFSFW